VIPTLPEEVRALYPFEPHWVNVGGRVLHYVDEGPRSPEAVVLLHGNPTWSFLYRKIIPTVADAGYRVLAPDFLGSGRSDHGIHDDEYAIVNHIARTLAVLAEAGVQRAVMFMQDWGGPIGMGMELLRPGLLAGAVLANTFWGEASNFHRQIFPWRAMHAPIAGALIFGRRGTFIQGLRLGGPPEVHDGPAWRAYGLPYEVHNASPGATLAWPRAIALGPDHPTYPLARAIWDVMPSFDVPTRFVWGMADAVFPWAEQGQTMRERLPRGSEHPVAEVPEGRHFVQEYAPEECAQACIAVAKEALG